MAHHHFYRQVKLNIAWVTFQTLIYSECQNLNAPKPDFCACRTLTAVTDSKQRCRSEDVKYTKQPQRYLNLGTKIKSLL